MKLVRQDRDLSYLYPKINKIKEGSISINDNGDIRLIKMDKRHTVYEFFKYCYDYLLSDKGMLAPNFITAHTRELIELYNGYNIDEELAERLIGGTIKQEGCYFTCSIDLLNKTKEK